MAQGKLNTFQVSCWGLGLVAFVELAAVGLALNVRPGEQTTPEPQIITQTVTVTEYQEMPGKEKTVIVEKPVYITQEAPEVPPLPDGPPIIDFDFEPLQDIKLAPPPIANPGVRELVEEARTFRIAGDFVQAFLRLEDASQLTPNDANVLYQLAEVHSAMGMYDQAADYYEDVFRLGTVKAGSLYDLAVLKLKEGIDEGKEMLDKFVLGRVRVKRDPNWSGGERIILTIPVSAAPNLNLSGEELRQALSVDVIVYDFFRDEPVEWDRQRASLDKQWVTPPIDWQGEGEELLRVIYERPSFGEEENFLFETRKYYGQVVELFYKGEVIDSIASPRRLASKASSARGEEALYYPESFIPDDFNFDNPLLPPILD